MPDVVLVVDMLRGFLERDYVLYCGDEARKIIPNLQKVLTQEQEHGSKIIFICDTHEEDDLEFKMFPPHCIRGTAEGEVIPELSAFLGEHISKRRYSAFFETDLGEKLRTLAPERIVVCGVCTDICVMHTVADARNRDYYVEVPANCVASFDPEAHIYALQHMAKILGAKITNSE